MAGKRVGYADLNMWKHCACIFSEYILQAFISKKLGGSKLLGFSDIVTCVQQTVLCQNKKHAFFTGV